MTDDLLEIDLDIGAAAPPDLLEAGPDDAEEVYRCGCADCRALRGRPECGREGGTRDG